MKRFFWVVLGFILLVPMSISFAGTCDDVNSSNALNILDVTYLINYLYKGGPAPDCGIRFVGICGDVNNSGDLNILDITYLISYLYKGGAEPDCQSYTLSDSVIVIPQSETTVVLNYDTTLGTVVLDESTSYAQEVSTGYIIIGQDDEFAPNGFLRKVMSKTAQGSSVILETVQASLMEAFESIDITETHQLKPSDVVSMTLHKGTKITANREDETFTVQLDCVLYDQDDDPETTDDQIRLDGQLGFTAALFIDIEQSWLTLEKFEVWIETNQNANIDLTANLQWEFDEAAEFDLAKIHLGAIPVGTLVWLVPTLTVEAHIHGDLTVTFETGITYTQQLKYGFGYANSAFYDISESEKSFTYLPPQFTAEFNFEPGVSMNASCLLYGVAGPYMAGKAGFHFQSILSADPCDISLTFDLEAILYAVVGIECDVLNLDYNKQFQLYTHPVCEWIYPLGGSGSIYIDPEPDALNAPWSLAGPCSYSTSGNGDESLLNLDPGVYTVMWGDILGWTPPSNSTQTLTAGQTLAFDGTYTPIADVQPPTVPQNLQCSAVSQSQINLSWNASTDNTGVTGYKLYRDGSYLKTVTGTNAFDNGLACGTPYCYRVSAIDAANNESAQSNQGCCTTNLCPDTQAPTVPQNLQCSAVSQSQINLSWNASTDNTGVTGYKLYRDGSYLKTVTGTNAFDNGLACGTPYCYRVSAIDAANNESAQSNQGCCTTNLCPDTQAPTVPQNLQCSAVSQSQINLSWNASTDNIGVSVYLIYRNGILLTIVSGSTLNYSDNDLSCNTQYCYEVSARDAALNESGRSNRSCCITFQCPPLPLPEVLSPNGGETLTLGGGYAITWRNNNPGSVYNYVKIEISNDGGNSTWQQVAYFASSTATSWAWNPIIFYCTSYGRIRVTLLGPYGSGSDVSNSNFSIVYAAPSLIAPANYATVVTTATTFSWNSVPNALDYTFQVSNNLNFTSPQLATKTVAGTNHTTLSGPWDSSNLTLSVGATYYWRVSVYDPRFGCQSNWSTSRQFRFGN